MNSKLVIITGYGLGLGESLAQQLLEQGCTVVGLSRSGGGHNNSRDAHQQSRIIHLACDVSDADSVSTTFKHIRDTYGAPDVLIHNAATLLLDDFLDINAPDFEGIWRTACLSAFLVTQELLPDMLDNQHGTLIYTGATASVKAGASSSAFASAKFALRGLAQSLARAYGPKGIHVVHTVLDGVIWGERAEETFKLSSTDCMKANDIVESYLGLITQKPSSWTHELDLRPFNETF